MRRETRAMVSGLWRSPPRAVAARPVGLVNGNGMTRTLGRRDGSTTIIRGGALTNGSGHVNGSTSGKPGPESPHPFAASRRRRRASLIGLLIAFVVVVAGALVLLVPPTGPTPRIAVDGDFADWSAAGIPFYEDAVAVENDDVSLRRYAHSVLDDRAYFAVEVVGQIFADPTDLDGVYIYVDSDADAATGYRTWDIGADALIRVLGSNGTITDAIFLVWRGSDPDDWRGWTTGGSAVAAALGSTLEVEAAATSLGLAEDHHVRLVATDFQGRTSVSSSRFGKLPGSLQVTQRGVTALLNGLDPFLELEFTARGSDVTVESLTFRPATPSDLVVIPPALPVVIAPGPPVILRVSVDVSPVAPGTLVTLELQGVRASRPYTIAGPGARAYAHQLPSGPISDGVFAEWQGAALHGDLGGDGSPSVDIVQWGTLSVAADLFLYVETGGDLLAGTAVLERPRLGGKGSAQPAATVAVRPRETGEDFLRVYVDVDPAAPEGEYVAGILADYFVDVAGKSGEVTSAAVYRWSSGWQPSSVPSFFVADRRAEGAVSLETTLPDSALIAIETTSWAGGDITDPFALRGTRGGAGPQPAATVPPSWPGWVWKTTDPDDGIADTTLDIRDVYAYNFWPGGYIYIRFVLKGTSPVLTDNSWWVYITNTSGNNDWLVIERPTGSGEVCTYGWDSANGDWGVGGAGCDISDTLTDTDVGSAVRVVSNCFAGVGCIDFALEKTDYPGLGQRPYVTLASDATEDLNLLGDTNRNPVSGGAGCLVAAFDDCTTPVWVPEFSPLVAAPLMAVIILLRRRRRRP